MDDNTENVSFNVGTLVTNSFETTANYNSCLPKRKIEI